MYVHTYVRTSCLVVGLWVEQVLNVLNVRTYICIRLLGTYVRTLCGSPLVQLHELCLLVGIEPHLLFCLLSRYDLCLRTSQVHSVLAVSRSRPSEVLAGCPDYHLRCYNTGTHCTYIQSCGPALTHCSAGCVDAVWMVCVVWGGGGVGE